MPKGSTGRSYFNRVKIEMFVTRVVQTEISLYIKVKNVMFRARMLVKAYGLC